jgi:hypothetical protein
LLAELVDLQRKSLANQEKAGARQEQNIALLKSGPIVAPTHADDLDMPGFVAAIMLVVPVSNVIGRPTR